MRSWKACLLTLIAIALMRSTHAQADPCFDDPLGRVPCVGHSSGPGCSPLNPPEQNDTCFVVEGGNICLSNDGDSLVVLLGRVLGDINKLFANGLVGAKAEVTMCFVNGIVGAGATPPSGHPVQFNINGRWSSFLPANDKVFPTPEPHPPGYDFYKYPIWQRQTYEVPIGVFNWASASGNPGQPSGAPVDGRNVIYVSTGEELSPWHNAVMIDWIAIKIRCADPVLLVHGWNGSREMWVDWNDFLDGLLGLPYDRMLDLGKSNSLVDNGQALKTEVDLVRSAYGADHVTLIGHSKGGIVSRRFGRANRDRVRHITTLCTPHLGTKLLEPHAQLKVAAVTAQLRELFGKKGVWSTDGPLGIGFDELSPNVLTPDRAAKQYVPSIQYESIAGTWDRTGGLGYTGSDKWAVRGLVTLGHLLAGFDPNGRGNDGVVTKASALGLPYGSHDSLSANGNPKYCHVRLPHDSDFRTDILLERDALGGFAPSAMLPTDGGGSPSFAQLASKVGAVIGSAAALDSTFCGDTGRVSCIIYVSDSTAQVSVRLPGIGWVDSTAAAADTSLVFARTEIFNMDATIISGQCHSPGEIVYRVQQPLAAATDTSVFGALAFVEGANGWTEIGTSASTLIAGSTVTVSLTGVDAGACTTCVDTVLVLAPNGSVTTVTMRDDGVSPDDLSGDGVAHGQTGSLGQAGAYSVVGKRTCRDSGGSVCRQTTDATTCNVVQSASTTPGTYDVVEGAHGLFDALFANLPIDMQKAGHVFVTATLSKDSVVIARAGVQDSLSAGSGTLQATFSGREIYNAGVDGPYLIEAQAEVETDSLAFDVELGDITTEAFEFTEFTHDLVQFADSLTWRGIDANSNGLFDTLAVRILLTSEIAGTFEPVAVLSDTLGHGLPCLGVLNYLAEGDTAITLYWPGADIGAAAVPGPLLVRDFATKVNASGGDVQVERENVGTLGQIDASLFEGFVPDNARAVAVHGVSALCPTGDGDSLLVRLKMPVPLGGSRKILDHRIYALRTATTGGPVTLWRTDSTGTTASDTLWITSYNDADTTAVVGWGKGSGCGTTSWRCYVDDQPVGDVASVEVRSVDGTTQAKGAVDRFDQAALGGAQGVTSGGCWDLNGSGGLVDGTDAGILTAHLGHHLPRQYASPTGQLTLAPGDTVQIKWRAGLGDSACVTIRDVRGTTSDTTIVVADRPESGSYTWTVPNTLRAASNHKIEVLHTAGRYTADYQNLGIAAGDTTITILPLRITTASAPMIGRTTTVLVWTEPTQVGGAADSCQVRRSTSAAVTDATWNSSGIKIVGSTFAPQAGGTDCCFDVTGLTASTTYYFGMRTKKNGLWSRVSNSVTVVTHSSGSNPFCDGGSLVWVGTGNGGAPTRPLHGDAASTAIAGAVNSDTPAENSLLWGAEAQVTDLCMLQGQGVSEDGSFQFQIRDVGFHQASLDHLSVGFVDHDASQVAIAGPDSVYIGSLEPVAGVTDVTGGMTAGLPVDSTGTFNAQAAQYLFVNLGETSTRPALVIESSGGVAGAYADSTGILVQKPSQESGWVTIATVHPRRNFAQSVVDAQGNQTLRIVFLRDYELKSLQRLTIASVTRPQPMTLLSADQSRIGSVTEAVNTSEGPSMTMSSGDTLSLRFGGTPMQPGVSRDLFLTAVGSYSTPAEVESGTSTGAPSLATVHAYQFALGAAHPNPSPGSMRFSYTMAKEGPVSIRIYNVAGRLMRTLVNEVAGPGLHDVEWNATDDGGRKVGAGVYFYRMDAGSWRSQRKVVFLER